MNIIKWTFKTAKWWAHKCTFAAISTVKVCGIAEAETVFGMGINNMHPTSLISEIMKSHTNEHTDKKGPGFSAYLHRNGAQSNSLRRKERAET